MEWISSEVVGVISYLLPGFVAAWVFYGLTAHPKSTPFERVVQALIFLAFVQAIIAIVRWTLMGVGHLVVFGEWTKEVALVWSVLIALGIGLLFAFLTNHNTVYRVLAKLDVTNRTSYPADEWFSAFNQHGKRYVVLHLVDERRLFGWPEQWPDHADSGHFVIAEPAWLLPSGDMVRVHVVERMLIAATDVRFVEFQKYDFELTVTEEEIQQESDKLGELKEPDADSGEST